MLAIDALLIKYFSFFVFTELAPLGRFSHRVVQMSVCLSVCLFVNLDPPSYLFWTSSKKKFAQKEEKNVTPNKKLLTPSKKNKKIYIDPSKKIADRKK